MEERIIKLESLLAEQDKTIVALHEEMYHQQRDIQLLKDHILKLENKIVDLEAGDEIAGNEKPPHY